jgi:ribosomal protein S18 acetylase RimI-like enzyme
MTPNVALVRAHVTDAEELARISREAFHSDTCCGGKGEGGPPGYDSAAWQARMMRIAAAYLRIEADGKTAGGLIVFRKGKGHCELGRIFLSPQYHRMGIGARAMRLMMDAFPECGKWTLETPPWNTRTRAFYIKLGFRIIGETGQDLFFELLRQA